MRILDLNTNGITSEGNYIEWENLLGQLDEMQVDVLNVDTRQSQVQYKLREEGKKWISICDWRCNHPGCPQGQMHQYSNRVEQC